MGDAQGAESRRSREPHPNAKRSGIFPSVVKFHMLFYEARNRTGGMTLDRGLRVCTGDRGGGEIGADPAGGIAREIRTTTKPRAVRMEQGAAVARR